MVQAHRFAYESLVGPVPEDRQLDHRYTCPKRCVRPDHLRLATRKQQRENLVGAQTNSMSGVRGVSWDARCNRWRADVNHNKQQFYLGRFATVEEAAAVVIAKRLEVFTHNDADRAVA